MTPTRSTKITNHAKGQQCSLRFLGICNGDWATTVYAHIRDMFKGTGIKASDLGGCNACSACHAYLDVGHGTRPVMSDVDLSWHIIRGIKETLEILVRDNIIFVPLDKPKVRKTRQRLPKEQRKRIENRGFDKTFKKSMNGAVERRETVK